MKTEINNEIYDIESVEITDKQIILNRKAPEFKAGDVAYLSDDGINIRLAILSNQDGDWMPYFALIEFNKESENRIYLNDECAINWKIKRHATESERQQLFDELRKQKKLKWNAETMKLEKIRWRAERNEWYNVISIIEGHGVKARGNETHHEIDDNRYNSGNYFNPNDPTDMAEAQSICDKINALFTARL